MGFRTGLSTPSELDTGPNGPRVRITQDGGTTGAGAVEVWPEGTDYFGPGYLEGGYDIRGPFVQLTSPPDVVDGERNTIRLGHGEPVVGRRGIEIRSTQDIEIVPGLNGQTRAYGLRGVPENVIYTRGFDMFSEFDHYGNPFRKLRRWINASGEQRIHGLIKPTVNLLNGSTYSMFYLSDYARGSVVLGAFVNATTKVRLDVGSGSSVVNWWAGNPTITAGAYIEIDLSIPVGADHPSGW